MADKKYVLIQRSNPANLEHDLNKRQDYGVFDSTIYSDGDFVTLMVKNGEGVEPGEFKVIRNIAPANFELYANELANQGFTMVDADLTNRNNITAIFQYGDRGGGGGGGSTGMFVGYVDESSVAFPTTRPDGVSPIENLDYARPLNTAVFPFTVEGVTFTNRFGKAVYYEGSWHYEEGLVPETHEVPVHSVVDESVNGAESTATTQADINIENVAEFQNKRRTDIAQNKWWFKNKSVNNIYLKDISGKKTTLYADYIAKIKSIVTATDVKPEDVYIPYKTNNSCLIFYFDDTADDIIMKCYCYSSGNQIIVRKYLQGADWYYAVEERPFQYAVGRRFNQTTKAAVWTFVNDYNTYPVLYVYDDDNNEIVPEKFDFVTDPTTGENIVKVYFSEPITGYVLIN